MLFVFCCLPFWVYWYIYIIICLLYILLYTHVIICIYTYILWLEIIGYKCSLARMLLFFNYLFIYSFIYLFLVALGLHSVLRLTLVVASKGYSLLWCMGFSFQWLILLQNTGSRCKLLYLQHMNSVVNSLWALGYADFSYCGMHDQ